MFARCILVIWGILGLLVLETSDLQAALMYRDVVLETNPVIYWPLDETGGPPYPAAVDIAPLGWGQQCQLREAFGRQ